MQSEVKVYERADGAIQRVHVVRFDDWSKLDFLHLKSNKGALDCFYDIYQNYLIPACPWIFENMIMFQLPETLTAEIPFESREYGMVSDRLTAVSIALQKGVRLVFGKPVFRDAKVKKLWDELVASDCIRIACGKRPTTKVIPVGDYVGYLSENEPAAKMKVNASFFIMDPIDCATIYDQVGTVLGLCVKDGVIINPPLFNREALLVHKDGCVEIREIDVWDLQLEINGTKYLPGKNATLYSRPKRAKVSAGKEKKLAIIGNRVVAVKSHGTMVIPASGFVMCVEEHCQIEAGDVVIYRGLEDVSFGIQVGNSIVRDGVCTENFISRFYNVYKLERVPFPPSLYPMDYQKARAARIALGTDKHGKPVIFWAEGAGKLGYKKGEDSTGASLTEMAEIACDIGLVNAVNLDGGGSAQILLQNERKLRISDRNKADNSDAERLVPLGLIVR